MPLQRSSSSGFGCLVAHLCLFPFPSRLLLGRSAQPAKPGSLAQVTSFTQTHSWGFGFHVALEEERKHLLWRWAQVDRDVTGAGCVLVSNKAFYLCGLGQTTQNSKQKWKQSLTSDLQKTLYASLDHWFYCSLDWCYLTRWMEEILFGFQTLLC